MFPSVSLLLGHSTLSMRSRGVLERVCAVGLILCVFCLEKIFFQDIIFSRHSVLCALPNYVSLSDNYVSLSNNYVSLSDNYVSLSDNYVSLFDNFVSLSERHTILCLQDPETVAGICGNPRLNLIAGWRFLSESQDRTCVSPLERLSSHSVYGTPKQFAQTCGDPRDF